MLIGIPNESGPGQPLVSATPRSVTALIKLGYQVVVEAGAGAGASMPDAHYEDAGATIGTAAEAWGADIVTALGAPTDAQLALMHPGATLISRLHPAERKDLTEALTARRITGLALDAIPRISRAQSMDVRSSMSNIAGYRAVIEAAAAFGRVFTGQVTAAGKMPPATVYVIGAGVAGLAAIGTAHALGAVVKATDVRPETAEQVESMGGEFVAIPVTQESADGYAKAMSDDDTLRAQAVYAAQAASADIVITTALIPGKAAPILLTRDAVAGMVPGSVIVDMGASAGGNVEGTVPGKAVTTDNGVRIIGYEDLPARLPVQASQLYGQNVVNFLRLATPAKDGQLVLDQEDPIVRGILTTHSGDITWPPPAIKVSAAPAPAPAPVAAPSGPADEKRAAQVAARKRTTSYLWKTLAVALFVLLILLAPPSMASHFVVFMLACVVGFYVITAVTHALHTPLMSETNAISAIIVVGAIMQITSGNLAVRILAFIALTVAAINIFGGFTVTRRMLEMFKRS